MDGGASGHGGSRRAGVDGVVAVEGREVNAILIECSLLFFVAGFAAGFSASRFWLDVWKFRSVAKFNDIRNVFETFVANHKKDNE